MKLSKDRTENIGEVYLPHMPVSKVLKSKVKKHCLRLQLVEDQSIFLKLTLLKMSKSRVS